MTNSQLDVLEHRFRLRSDVELIEGADGAPMLFDTQSGHYVRLGKQAARIVRNLDGSVSGAQIVDRIAARSGVERERVEPQLARLLGELSASGVFEGFSAKPAVASAKSRLVGAVSRTPTWTKPLLREGLTTLVDPVSRVLKAAPAVTRVVAALALLGCSLVCAITAVRGNVLPQSSTPWLVAMGLLLIQMVVHELGHAVSCRVHGVKPRELGVALWYGVIPIAYVDRTDAYRIRGRGARAAISIVGPFQDMVWAGLYGLVAQCTDGFVHELALSSTVLSLTMVVVNLNPLLPTDGQQALESVLGELNLRGRAMAYLAHLVMRTELPTYLTHLSTRRKAAYVLYGAACVAYVIFVMGGMAMWAFTMSERILGALA